MRRAMLTAVGGIPLPAIGEAFMGGFYVGIIDTTKGNIIPTDASQTGLRYALIVAPASLQTVRQYKTAASAAPAATRTRWDGLAATLSMNQVVYEAAQYCSGLSYPSDGASQWYLPAMDELELIYRNLKASTEGDSTWNQFSSIFPPTAQDSGYNPSSDPAKAAYSSGEVPQTAVTAFRSGGAQALGLQGNDYAFWTSTEYNGPEAWAQYQSGSSVSGRQASVSKDSYSCRIRPVRRLIL